MLYIYERKGGRPPQPEMLIPDREALAVLRTEAAGPPHSKHMMPMVQISPISGSSLYVRCLYQLSSPLVN